MGVFSRKEKRYNGFTASFTSPPIPPPGGVGAGYADVNLSRAEASLQSVAMWSALDMITSLASELPVDVFTGTKRSRRPVPTPSYMLDPSGDGQGLEDWIAQLVTSWLLRGNGNGKIATRDRREGFPTQVVLYHPDTVAGRYDADGMAEWRVGGRDVETADMWHKRVHPISGQLMGLSPVAYCASTIGLSLVSQRFGAQWFLDGGHPSAMLTNSELELNDPMITQVKQKFLAAVYGTREPLVMGKGWAYKEIQINPEESQFLQTQGFTEAQTARMFGAGVPEVLGYETKSALTYATLEGRMRHLLVLAVNRWLRRVERALNTMLPQAQYTRLNRDAMLQTSFAERWKIHEIATRIGAKVINEVRDDEDLQPVPWGNEPWSPKNEPVEDPDEGKKPEDNNAV